MQDLGPGYAPIEDQRPPQIKPPVGGVPLFPNLTPVSIWNISNLWTVLFIFKFCNLPSVFFPRASIFQTHYNMLKSVTGWWSFNSPGSSSILSHCNHRDDK